MGGWFSKTEVVDNGTASVEYHPDTLQTTMLLVFGGFTLACLAAVTAKWCISKKALRQRNTRDAERAIAMSTIEGLKRDHEKEITAIRHSINLQNAQQMGSSTTALATTRALASAPLANEPKNFVYPQF